MRAALIIGAVLVVYAPVLRGGYLWDDRYLVQSPAHGQGISDIFSILKGDVGTLAIDEKIGYYRPVLFLSFFLERVFGGPAPFISHFVNILLHILAALLVYYVGARWSKDADAAFLASVLFAVHPANVAAVAYVSGRADPLAAVFVFLGFWFCCLVRGPRRPLWGMAGVASFILALLCRESAIVFPLLCVVYGVWAREKLPRSVVGALAAVVVIYVFLRAFVPGLSPVSYAGTSVFQRVPGVFRVVYESLRVLVWPVGLHMEYGRPLFSWSDPGVVLGVSASSAGLFFLARSWRKDPEIPFGLVWFAVGLLPFLGLVPLISYFAEHWLYLPGIGLFWVAGIVVSRERRNKRLWLWGLSMAAIIFWVPVAGYLARLWTDPIALYERTLMHQPRSIGVRINLAMELEAKGEREAAVEVYRQAIALAPGDPRSYANLGALYAGRGDLDNALLWTRRGVEVAPEDYRARDKLAAVLARRGDLPEALLEADRAVMLSPERARARVTRAGILGMMGRHEAAAAEYQEAVTLVPGDPRLRYDLGRCYALQGDSVRAAAALRAAVDLRPGSPELWADLSGVFSALGLDEEAAMCFAKALRGKRRMSS